MYSFDDSMIVVCQPNFDASLVLCDLDFNDVSVDKGFVVGGDVVDGPAVISAAAALLFRVPSTAPK
jgi:hypothetical protein